MRLVDTPVLGTEQPAEQGKLVVRASGPAHWIEQAVPVLDPIGAKTVVVGAEGAASFRVDGLRKDLDLIAHAAEQHGLPSALLAGVRSVFDAAAARGHPADDVAAACSAFDVSPG